MAYSLPELVLVGAAQNLVLETSDEKNPFCTGLAPLDQDPWVVDTYNVETTW